MVKNSLLWCYRATLAALWFIIIAFSLIVLSLRYLVLPNVGEYQGKITQLVSNAMGQPVTIGKIHASWNGLNPRLSLHNIDIYDHENRVALSFDHIETSLSWLSIPLLEPRFSSIIIYDPALTIRREIDGTVYVAGIPTGGPARPQFTNWLLRQSHINVSNATITWQDDLRKAPPLTLTQLNLRIDSPAWEGLVGHHRFGLQAQPSAGSSQPIDLRGNLYGKDISQPDQWHGTLYAHAEGTNIAAWRQWLPQLMDIRQGYGASRLWLEFADGTPEKLTTDVLLSNVVSRMIKNQPDVALDKLSGRLTWIKHKDGQEVRAENLKIATPSGLDMQSGKVVIRERKQGKQESIEGQIALDEIQLESAHALAAYFPIPEKPMQALAAIQPVGILRKLNLAWNSHGGFPETYKLHTQFSELGMQAYGHIPGFSKLNGTIDASEAGGTVALNAINAEVDVKGILRWPLPADKLSGQIKWQTNDGKTDVRVNNLAISNKHLAGAINASFLNNHVKGGMLELAAKFNRVDGQYARFYYPLVLGETTMDWLDTSIRAGKSEDVSVTIKGHLHDFPFDGNKNGLFQVKAKIHDGELEFAPGWPKIEKIALDMLFQGNRMELNATSGSTLGTQVIKSKVVIPILDSHQPVLSVISEGQGLVSNGIQYLNNSPLKDITGGFTQGLQTSGNGKLALDLLIPLHDTDATKVKGSYTITNGTLSSVDVPELSRINGKLEFTESILRGQNLNTWVYGGPAIVNLASDKDRIIRINARGRVTDAGLRAGFGPGFSDRIFGTTDWYGDINIAPNQADISIRSSLAGITSSLPFPLNKSSDEKVPLKIEKKQQSPQQDTISINYGNILGAKLLRTKQNGALALERGDIAFNTLAELPQQPGLTVHGNIDHLDIDEWRALSERSGTANGNTSNGASSNNANIRKIDLSVAKFDIFDRRINDLKLNANAIKGGWQMNVQSQEMNGDIQWLSQGNGKIVARLKRLLSPSATPDTAVLRTQGKFSQQGNITEYPSLDIVADSFEFGKKKLGKLELLASEQDDDWSIEKLRISNPESELMAEGEWHNWKRAPNTRLNINWKISDLGQTLERFGYPSTIKGGTANLTGQLKWPGSPHEFETTLLSGNLQLDVRKGQILKIQPGVGRLFSVLTLQNLPRRLTFDFRDVFSSGFAFDKIGANVSIDNGIMRSDDFRLEGPTALVEMKGETNLQKETQHLRVKVTPYISDSLSIAALAGGPVVGAATYIAQKLLKDPLNQFASSEYEFIGTWDNPVEVKAESKTKNNDPAVTPLGR
ncbi:TIGR02099 family protein [Methylobacillus gramineus]|uniref:YhdP family protein n=1 Tax=Methylobacillus gramineus TaxID=755169 RepID=UPI001CFFF218|nr:YhdP family protein [Methylobacillus gramineus]MCB5184591.1 TIGR02099 family protein [Methylobacillus gramineus]